MCPDHDDPLGGDPRDGARSGALLEISNEIVRLYKEQFGRGPTRARTNWAVVLRDARASLVEQLGRLVAVGTQPDGAAGKPLGEVGVQLTHDARCLNQDPDAAAVQEASRR